MMSIYTDGKVEAMQGSGRLDFAAADHCSSPIVHYYDIQNFIPGQNILLTPTYCLSVTLKGWFVGKLMS